SPSSRVASTLLWAFSSGAKSAVGSFDSPARCTTDVTPSSHARSIYLTSAWITSSRLFPAENGLPNHRVSTTLTLSPSESNSLTSTLPTYPAPPVTRIMDGSSHSVRDAVTTAQSEFLSTTRQWSAR